MVRKWEAMNYLQKFRKISVFALLVVMPSVTFASSVVTSQTYVDMQDGLKQDIQIGAAPVGNANSTDAGKVLVVDTDGKISMAASGTVGPDVSGKEDKSNKLNGTATTGQKIGDLAAGSAANQDQVMYPSAAAVKEYAVAKNQGTGTNNANVGKTLVVNSSGVLELDTIDALPAGTAANQMLQYDATNSEWDVVNIDTTPTANNTVPVTSGGVKTYVDGKITQTLTTATATAPSENTVKTALEGKQTKPTSGVANGKVLTYTGTDANASVSAAYVTVPVAAGAPSTNTPTAFSEVWVQSL